LGYFELGATLQFSLIAVFRLDVSQGNCVVDIGNDMNVLLFRCVVVFICSVLCGTALAAWAEIPEGRKTGVFSSRLFVDKANIKKAGNQTIMYVLEDFDEPHTWNISPKGKKRYASVASQITYVEFDCVGESSRIIDLSGYSGQMGSGIEYVNQAYVIGDKDWRSTRDRGTQWKVSFAIACGK
jgi:hypothetical protein